jgi:hypothetical protein
VPQWTAAETGCEPWGRGTPLDRLSFARPVILRGRHVDFLAKPAQRAPQDFVGGHFGGPLDDDHPPADAPHGGERHYWFTFQVGQR